LTSQKAAKNRAIIFSYRDSVKQYSFEQSRNNPQIYISLRVKDLAGKWSLKQH
jgi:hypothetical protein